ncbi:MAG TPA: HAD-IA family hydrolase [Casimicrobiaceae bacterium]|nr:HAD-IA family hydrolase [Casimicrobiaceae bacterium]
MMASGLPTLRPRRYRLIVFDWDGTLADSTVIIASSIQRACGDLGLPVPDDRAARHVIGLGLADALRYVAPTLPEERYPELSLRYRDHYLARDPEIPLFEGAAELLRELRAAGYLLGVATGKSRRGLDRALDQQGLRELFHHTRCADEGRPKPDPDMLHCLMERSRVAPSQTLMIGDTSHDVELAHNAGAGIVAVSYGAHALDDLRLYDAVPIVHSLAELRAWIAQNG